MEEKGRRIGDQDGLEIRVIVVAEHGRPGAFATLLPCHYPGRDIWGVLRVLTPTIHINLYE